jgi:hypothetical protein
MDRWLDNVDADTARGTQAEKVARNKPAELADACWATNGERIVKPASYDDRDGCNQLYPPHADPRIVAGAPLVNDILKCALKPLSAADYSHPLTDGQMERLKAVFPDGVCDFSRSGIGQETPGAPWQFH